MQCKLFEDNGFLDIEVEPAKQGEHPSAETPSPAARKVRLDLYRSHNTYIGLSTQHSDAIERGNVWVEWLASEGLPKLSHGEAYRLADIIAVEVAAFQGKFSPQPSPSQTPG